MTTSSVSSAPTVSLGNAQDVSGLVNSSVGLSLAEAVTTKVQPYLDKATSLQTEINTNHTQIAAYQNMQSLLSALQGAASNLTTESLQGSNVFQSRAANLASAPNVAGYTAPAAASILTAAVANGTDTGSHSVIVNQLAQSEADTSDNLAVGPTDPISNAGIASGSFTVAENGKTSPQAVTISANMTLTQVAAAINAASTANGVSASVVSVDSTHSVLVLTAQDADTPINFTDPNGVLTAMGVISGPSTSSVTGTIQNDPVATQAGAFTAHAGSASTTVTVNPGDDAQTIANNFNIAGNFNSLSATLDANNALVITDTANNPVSFSDDQGGALEAMGLSSVAKHQVRQPQALNLTVDGVANITRDSNTVSDVLSGVTLNVTQADPKTTVSVGIAPNANTAATAIQSFVTAYNSWEGFVQQNEATDSSGNAAANATLFGDATLRQASLEVDSSINQEINNTSLGAIGISLDGSNNMQIDATTLDGALNDNFQMVADLFQSTLTSASPNLVPSGSNLSNFGGQLQFTIGMTGSAIGSLAVMANGQNVSNNFIFAGNTIQGLYGTPYSGMFFTYNGTGETTTVTSTQGVGNMVYSAANKYANTTTGTVQSLIDDKQTQDLQFTGQYNNWVNEANNYTDFLLNQYSALTSKIQSAGQTLNTLNALFQAQFSSNG